MNERRPWTREELLLAINLYVKIPFGKIHNKNPDIIYLAEIIDRTPSSISYKLANFASLDPSLHQKGASHTSSLDKAVWEEFFSDWDKLLYESEQLLESKATQTTDIYLEVPENEITEKQKLSIVRTKQGLFRKAVLSSFDNKCCLTGMNIPDLLVASHIVPWSVDRKNRLNPSNGLCLNAFHDKAFDKGYITLLEDFSVKVSSAVREGKNETEKAWLLDFEGRKILLPKRFLPSGEFLEYHRKEVFIG
ncbi:MAG: HNH endonuclease [Candidatus Melainabacteria bacterium]